MTRARPGAPRLVALVAVFWLAQLLGVAHGISHLERGHGAPHAAVCTACVAAADTVAGPAAAAGAPLLLAVTDAAPLGRIAAFGAARRLPVYRSRAPPPALI